jgi:outer membrane murein-binding lipoprotein Lpp
VDDHPYPTVECAQEESTVKKIIVLAVIAMIALSGCFSSGFLGFLATQDYVDKKAKEQAAEIASLKAQLADYQSIKTQAQAAIDQMNQSQKAIQDLQSMALRTEARINSIPREVIGKIADILQASQGQ